MTAEDEIVAARAFLAPILNRDAIIKARGLSIIDRLIQNDHTLAQINLEPRTVVIKQALDFLLSIHRFLYTTPDDKFIQEFLYNSENRRIIETLLDLISLEGVYPTLLSGVGIPIERRVKSVLQGGLVTRPTGTVDKQTNNPKNGLLEEIVVDLVCVATCKGNGLGGIMKERALVDLIAALGQLGYGSSDDKSESYRRVLEKVLDEIPLPVLFPILTALLHPATPSWLRPYLSNTLSSLPLRPGGVYQTIIFLAVSAPGGYHQADQQASLDGPSLSLDVLHHASKILSSVPSTVSADDYFKGVAPQLLSLLDGKDIDMRRAASFIIGTGILGRRTHGAPGTMGWRLFAQPIAKAINPQALPIDSKSSWGDSTDLRDSTVLVHSTDLHRALHRLKSLLLIHPNPGLTNRLLKPLLLPLWALMCRAKEVDLRDQWFEDCSDLLSTYFRISGGVKSLIWLVDHLIWDGGENWIYKSDGAEGINLCQRSSAAPHLSDIISHIQKTDTRVETFRRLLESSGADETEIGEIFLHTTGHWLQGYSSRDDRMNIVGYHGDAEKVLCDLVYAKVTQELLGKYKDNIAKSPVKLIRLIHQILEGGIRDEDEKDKKRTQLSNPTIARLGSIVKPRHENIQGSDPSQDGDDSSEIISTCLSLLSTILSSPEMNFDLETQGLLDVLKSTLAILAVPHLTLSSSVGIMASNVLALIDFRASPESESLPAASHKNNIKVADLKTHSLALSYLGDTLPPIRAQGLSLLTTLITSSSPVLDIPSTCILLLSLLQDLEEVIYLSAIKALGNLASKHSQTVIKMLIESYVDNEEELDLDQRLRVGEALLKTIESLGEVLVGSTSKFITEAIIAVASRRGKREKEIKAHNIQVSKTLAQNREAEEAWGGEVPTFDDDDQGEKPNPMTRHFTKILSTWQGPPGTEDLRIRTSALSILGIALETNIVGVGATLTSTAIDLVLSILTLEIEVETAILRRAAVLVIMSFVKAMDRADEEGKRLGFGLEGKGLEEVVRVLKYVKVGERDEIVRGHVGEVLVGLEVWREKMVMGYVGRRGEERLGLEIGEGGLRGLDINPNSDGKAQGRSRPRLEEIE